MKNLISKIQAALSPDLLEKQYRAENATNPMFGHCYVATEALYYLLGDKETFGPCYGRDESGIVHWWLVNKNTSEIHDVTADQYTSKGLVPPYHKGKRSGFLTNVPSKRCQVVLERVGEISN